MFKLRASLSAARSLAEEWRALLGAALAMARALLRIEATQPRKALAQAELLNAWTTAALTQLSHQITASGPYPNGDPVSEQLPPAASILMMIQLFLLGFIRRLRARLLSERWHAPRRERAPMRALKPAAAYALLDPG